MTTAEERSLRRMLYGAAVLAVIAIGGLAAVFFSFFGGIQ